jgi:putative heme-binding domain-containing protein
VQEKGAVLLASLDEDRATQREYLEELVAALERGDVRRGQEVFNSSKTACATCHKIGYLGGRVGPDLTRIGQIREERDLLEAVVFPSASFVRSYEPVVVVTASETYNGVTLEENDDYILLATGADTEQRISRNAIVELRPGTVSVMPSGLEQELSRQDLWDLVAFLKETHRRN